MSALTASIETPPPFEEFVITPGGLRPKSQVHEVPSGSEIRLEGDTLTVVSNTGEQIGIYPNTPAASPARTTGWLTSVTSNRPEGQSIMSGTAYLTIPPIPRSVHEQRLHVTMCARSLEGATCRAAFHVMLAFNYAMKKRWDAIMWYITDTAAVHSATQHMEPGTEHQLIITMHRENEKFRHEGIFGNVRMGVWSDVDLPRLTLGLGVRDVEKEEDLPDGNITINRVCGISSRNGNQPAAEWTVVNAVADGWQTEVIDHHPMEKRMHFLNPAKTS